MSMSLEAAIDRSAAPAAIRLAVERAGAGLRDRIEADERLADAFVAVTAASRSLTELVLSDPAAVE
ncbi:MAG: hypothetical protein M3163_03080, partial [Actinomycetota bacterium]|nr:hypothetical protein [Actinomycetota bacterium]